jgi:DNA-binding NtrC family response regulator
MKLLRAIENREVRPLGDTETRQVDVRLVSATHRDLEAAIEEGSFRRDLLYRLNVVTLFVPPLRRRRVDIPFLAQHFAEELGAAQARRITLDEAFLDALSQRDFPGNVRELRNAVERAITLAAEGEPVSVRDLPPAGPGPGREPRWRGGTLRERIALVEEEAIREALEQCQGNRRRMAELLGLSRPGLRYKMRRLGLGTPDEK